MTVEYECDDFNELTCFFGNTRGTQTSPIDVGELEVIRFDVCETIVIHTQKRTVQCVENLEICPVIEQRDDFDTGIHIYIVLRMIPVKVRTSSSKP